MENMDNSVLLNLTLKTKAKDNVKCSYCNKGIMIPFNQQSETNHIFICNHCGAEVTLDCLVTVE